MSQEQGASAPEAEDPSQKNESETPAAAATGGNDENKPASAGGPNDPIVEPSEVDVLCGRGGMSNHHPGNEWYRRLIRSNRPLYRACPKHTKLLVSKAIVQAVEQQGGRFLERNKKSGVWVRVSYKRAVDKTSQGLRERDREEDHTRDDNAAPGGAVEVPDSFRGMRGPGAPAPSLNDLAEVAIAHATGRKGPPLAAAAAAAQRGVANKRPPEGALPATILPGTLPGTMPPGAKRPRPNPVVAPTAAPPPPAPAAPPLPPPPPVAAPPAAREEQNLSPLPPSLQVRQSSMFRLLENSKLLSSGVPQSQQQQQQQQAAAAAAVPPPPGALPSFPTKLNNLQPDVARSSSAAVASKNADNERAAAAIAAAAAAQQAQQVAPVGFPPASPQVSVGMPPGAVAPPTPPAIAPPSPADILATAAVLRQQGVNPAALAAATSGLYRLASGAGYIPPPQTAAQFSGAYSPQPRFLSAATSAASMGAPYHPGSVALQQPPPPAYGASGPGVSGYVTAPMPPPTAPAAAGPVAAGGPAGGAAAPSLTRLQSQVSDWLNNSFWPVPVPARGMTPASVGEASTPPPQQQQQQQPPAAMAATLAPAPLAPTINSRKMSRHLAVSTATAIAQMIPPPAPSVMQERKGLFHKNAANNKKVGAGEQQQEQLSSQLSPQAAAVAAAQQNGATTGVHQSRMFPAITTVPPPPPTQPVQIHTIPPMQRTSSGNPMQIHTIPPLQRTASGKAAPPGAAVAAGALPPQAQKPPLVSGHQEKQQSPSLTTSPRTTTAPLAGGDGESSSPKAPALKSTATSELANDLASTESELRRTELEQSVSASLLALASAPSRLFSGFTSAIFGDKTAGTATATSSLVGGDSRSTTPGPPSTGATPPPPPLPPQAAGTTPQPQVASFKKSKKSLLDDEPENPDEARLRAVAWH